MAIDKDSHREMYLYSIVYFLLKVLGLYIYMVLNKVNTNIMKLIGSIKLNLFVIYVCLFKTLSIPARLHLGPWFVHVVKRYIIIV